MLTFCRSSPLFSPLVTRGDSFNRPSVHALDHRIALKLRKSSQVTLDLPYMRRTQFWWRRNVRFLHGTGTHYSVRTKIEFRCLDIDCQRHSAFRYRSLNHSLFGIAIFASSSKIDWQHIDEGRFSLHEGVRFIYTMTSSEIGSSGHERGCHLVKTGSSAL